MAETTTTKMPVLTDRDTKILCMVADGLPNHAIGQHVFLSEDSVKVNMRELCKKVRARNRAHLVKVAYDTGLLERGPLETGVMPPMTAREFEVLRLVADGQPNLMIGRRLHISENTVKTHLGRVFRRLKAANRAHAIGLAYRVGLLPDGPSQQPAQPVAVPVPVRTTAVGPARHDRPAVAVTSAMLTAVQAAVRTRNTHAVIRAVLEAAGFASTRPRSACELAAAAVTARRPVIVITDLMLTTVQGAVLGGNPLTITVAVLGAAGLTALRSPR